MEPLYARRVREFKPRRRLDSEEPGRVFGYIRVSDPKQQDNTSLENQRVKIAAHAATYYSGFPFSGYREDVHTAKGRFADRPAGKALLGELRRGDVLVVNTVDRFSRTTVDGLYEMRDLWQKGVTVVCLDMGGIPITFDDVTGQIHFFMLLFTAEMENRRRSARAKDAAARLKADVASGKRKKPKRKQTYARRADGSISEEFRSRVRSLMALYDFACHMFGYSKCDSRHGALALKYGLPVAKPIQYIRWFKAEQDLISDERVRGIVHNVPEPWRAHHVAGILLPDPPATLRGCFRKPINTPGDASAIP